MQILTASQAIVPLEKNATQTENGEDKICVLTGGYMTGL